MKLDQRGYEAIYKVSISYILVHVWNACMHHLQACLALNHWELWEQNWEPSTHFTILFTRIFLITMY